MLGRRPTTKLTLWICGMRDARADKLWKGGPWGNKVLPTDLRREVKARCSFSALTLALCIIRSSALRPEWYV